MKYKNPARMIEKTQALDILKSIYILFLKYTIWTMISLMILNFLSFSYLGFVIGDMIFEDSTMTMLFYIFSVLATLFGGKIADIN